MTQGIQEAPQSLRRRLPVGGGNLFQLIKERSQAAQAAGIRIIPLGIGQPSGAAPEQAREIAAQLILSDEEKCHEYQDNGCPAAPDFAKDFVRANLGGIEMEHCAPIPGIKTTLWNIIMACQGGNDPIVVYTATNPGYGTPAVAAEKLGHIQEHLVLTPENGFIPRFKDLGEQGAHDADLIMLNYPHNPTGQIMPEDRLREIMEFCVANDVRLSNDGAYTLLDHTGKHTPLAKIAGDYPQLSWFEAYSASKLWNMTGWRVGAVTGSKDFFLDFLQMKGDLDSGLVGPMAGGVQHLVNNHMEVIHRVAKAYELRMKVLNGILEQGGLVPAVAPSSGFFLFYHCPEYAFGQKIKDAEHFNMLMIENTGIVGVHFGKYIRYSVAGCEFKDEEVELIAEGFSKAQIG